MGRVQVMKREGKQLPPGCAVDAEGKPTTDPNKAVALLPFGAHKGYGLGLIDELYAGLHRRRAAANPRHGARRPEGEKRGSTFYFPGHPSRRDEGQRLRQRPFANRRT